MKNQDLFDYAVESFGFVLPFDGTFSLQRWAEEIIKVYDEANLQVSAVVEEINKHKGQIIRRCGSSTVVLN